MDGQGRAGVTSHGGSCGLGTPVECQGWCRGGKTRMVSADQELPQMTRVKPEEGRTWTPGLERILRLPLWL